MEQNNKLVVFQDKKIRRTLHNGEWYFSVIDVVEALAESPNPRNYWNMLKARELEHGIELYTNCVQLKLPAEDGKLQEPLEIKFTEKRKKKPQFLTEKRKLYIPNDI